MSYIKDLLNLQGGAQDQDLVFQDVAAGISFKGSNLWILACAIFIASIGLNVNSTAVIIGAMLISPLMGPIVGGGFALATYNFDLLKKSGKNLLIATVVSLLVSSLYFYLSPFKDADSELLSRTAPTIYDVLIAFFGGIVGAISITRKEKGNPIPGVAIATALMPPLCTAGFGLATLNFSFFAGALYLYFINCFFIGISTFLIIKFLKYKTVVTENKSFDKRIKTIITAFLIVLILPSLYLAYSLLQEKKFTQNVDAFIKTEFTDKGSVVIYKKVDYKASPKTIDLGFLSQSFDSLQIANFNTELIDFGIKNTVLNIKQYNSQLKSEIMSEINSKNTNISEKDFEISSLRQEIQDYQIADQLLFKEVQIIFPALEDLAVGKVKNFTANDSTFNSTVVIFKAKQPLDINKLKDWLSLKLNDKNLEVIQLDTDK